MQIPYGKTRISVDLTDADLLDVPPLDGSQLSLNELFQSSISHPVDGPSLPSMLSPSSKICVLLPDMTRSAELHLILPHFVQLLAASGVPSSSVFFLIALGIHRPMSKTEICAAYGDKIKPFACYNHEAENAKILTNLGRTSFNTPIDVNRRVLDTDLIISFSKIGFHYNAGFSGGRKMFLPGIASKEACMANHRLVLTGQPYPEKWRREGVVTGKLSGNPVHEDMLEFISAIDRPCFSVNIITTPNHQVQELICGELVTSHLVATERFKSYYMTDISEPYDLLIASCGGFPYDIDMIQCHKGIDSAFQAVKPDGAIIFFAECANGMGHPDFFPWFDSGGLEEMTDALNRNYQIYGQTAAFLKVKADTCRIYLKSGLQDKNVEKMGLTPFQRWETVKEMCNGKRVGVMPHACSVFPQTI